MTKKHFEFVASLINAANNGTSPQQLAIVAAVKFGKENPLFDAKRFLSACGIKWEGGWCADGLPLAFDKARN